MRIRALRSAHHSRSNPTRQQYEGKDCMVGYLNVSDKLRLHELREAESKANDAFQEFYTKLAERVKKENKQDILDMRGDMDTAEVEFYRGTKYLVTFYVKASKVKVSSVVKKQRKSKEKK